MLLSLWDTHTGWVEVYAVGSKDECGSILKQYVSEVGLPTRVRTDNEPTFKGGDSNWKIACRELQIKPTHSQPYEPQTNGNVERWHRTMGDALRANMMGVDPSLWDWCARYICHVFNRIQRKPGKPSAYQKRFHRPAKVDHFRRFGTLCFEKIHRLSLK